MATQSKSKSGLKTGIAIAAVSIPILIAGIAIATNPGKETYTEYALQKLCEYPDFPPEVADRFDRTCKEALASEGLWGRDRLKNMISSRTEQQNLFFLTIYKTDVLGKTVTTIGAFGQLITVGVS